MPGSQDDPGSCHDGNDAGDESSNPPSLYDPAENDDDSDNEGVGAPGLDCDSSDGDESDEDTKMATSNGGAETASCAPDADTSRHLVK